MLVRKKTHCGGDPVKYLVDGIKEGRKFTRDEIDHRVQICGDLALLDKTIKYTQKNKNWKSNYQHFTFGLTERDMEIMNKNPEKMEELCNRYLEFYYAHHAKVNDKGEVSLPIVYSAELHLPKLKYQENKTTGKLEKRYPHIHLVVSDLDISNGNKLEPALHNNRAMRAFQSDTCEKLGGLDDPKNFLRADLSLSKADLISRWKKTLQDGPELQRELLSELVIEQYYRTKDSENFQQDFKAALLELGVNKFKADGDGVTLSFDSKLLGIDNEIKPIKIQSHKIDGKPSHLTVEGYTPPKISAIKASRISESMSDTVHGGLSQRQALELFNSARKKPKQALRTHFRNEFSDLLAGVQSIEEVRKALDKLPCTYTQQPGKPIKVTVDVKALGINQTKPVNFDLRGGNFEHLHRFWTNHKEKNSRTRTDSEIWKQEVSYRVQKYRKKHDNRTPRKLRDLDELQALREDWFKSRTKTSKVLFYVYKNNFHLTDIDNFHTFKKDNARYIVNKSNKVQVVDKGDKIIVATDTDVAMQKGVRVALLAAKSKGWDMDSLVINGGARFQSTVKAQIALIKEQEASNTLFDAPPSQIPTDKPTKNKKTKTTKAPTRKKNQKRDSVTSSVRDQVDGQRKLKKPTNEVEYYNKNIKAESVLDHCSLSDKIKMDISKYEIARNRIRPAGTSQKGLNVIDFLMREGNMSFQAAKSTLELLSQDDSNLRNKNMPKPVGKEAQEPAKKSSAPQPQQKEETKQQPTAQTEKPGQPAPAVPVAATERPTQPVKSAAQLSDMDKRIQCLRDIPKPVFDSKIAQLGGKSRSGARNVYANLLAAKPTTERDIQQLEALVEDVDLNKIYPGTWSTYECKIFHAGQTLPGLQNDDGHELTSEEQKVIYGRLKNNYESNNNSLKQPK